MNVPMQRDVSPPEKPASRPAGCVCFPSLARHAGVRIVRILLLVPLVSLAPATSTVLLGQTTGANPAYKEDSDDLHVAFFRFHGQFAAWIDAQKTAMPSRITELDQGTAHIFRLSSADLPKVSAVSKDVNRDFAAIDSEERAYINRQAAFEQPPHRTVTAAFAARRGRAAREGIARLRADLGPQGWSPLRDFINTRLRSSIQAVPARGPSGSR